MTTKYVCPKCKTTHVQCLMWVDPNTGKPPHSLPRIEKRWCNLCKTMLDEFALKQYPTPKGDPMSRIEAEVCKSCGSLEVAEYVTALRHCNTLEIDPKVDDLGKGLFYCYTCHEDDMDRTHTLIIDSRTLDALKARKDAK